MQQITLQIENAGELMKRKDVVVNVPIDKARWFTRLYKLLFHDYWCRPDEDFTNETINDFMTLLKQLDLESHLRTAINYGSVQFGFPPNSVVNAAINNRNIVLAKLYFQLGKSINGVGYANETALHEAIKLNNIDLAEFCILNGANIDAEMNMFKTPLHLAINNNNIDTVKWCIDNKATVRPSHLIISITNYRNKQINELLIQHRTQEWNDAKILKYIDEYINHWGDPDKEKYYYETLEILLKHDIYGTKNDLNDHFLNLADNMQTYHLTNDVFYNSVKLLLRYGVDQYSKYEDETFIMLMRFDNMAFPVPFTQKINADIQRITSLVTIFPVYQQYQTITVVFHGILPTYVMLWIGDWLVKDELLEYQKVEIIEKMNRSIEKVKEKRV